MRSRVAANVRGARSFRALVAAFRGDELSMTFVWDNVRALQITPPFYCEICPKLEIFRAVGALQSSFRRNAETNARNERAPRKIRAPRP